MKRGYQPCRARRWVKTNADRGKITPSRHDSGGKLYRVPTFLLTLVIFATVFDLVPGWMGLTAVAVLYMYEWGRLANVSPINPKQTSDHR